MRAAWLERMRDVPIANVAERLGLVVQQKGTRVSVGPCPSCNAERRHPSRRDKRAALGLTRDGCGWRCHECQASGSDATDLVAYVLRGSRFRELRDEGKVEIRTWCCSFLGLDPSRPPAAPPRPRPPPPPPNYPRADEVALVWSLAVPVIDNREVATWLRDHRGLSPVRIADLDIARALPRGLGPKLPKWAGTESASDGSWAAWTVYGARLLVPMFDAAGEMRSLRARSLRLDARVKELPPQGYDAAGLVMMDPAAQRMISGEPLSDLVVVVEGTPDFLTWASRASDADDEPPAIIGVVSGGWTRELADRVPEGTRVAIRIHTDPTGDGYSSLVASSLADRCRLFRLTPDAAEAAA